MDNNEDKIPGKHFLITRKALLQLLQSCSEATFATQIVLNEDECAEAVEHLIDSEVIIEVEIQSVTHVNTEVDLEIEEDEQIATEIPRNKKPEDYN